MANLIRTSLNAILAIIQNDTGAILAALPTPRSPFTQFGFAFTGISMNPPGAWVMPRSTEVGDDGNLLPQVDQITVKLAIVGSDPEDIADQTLDYVKAVDQALRDAAVAEIDPTILHLHPQLHDYGPLYEHAAGFGKFPEIHVVVERVEVDQ